MKSAIRLLFPTTYREKKLRELRVDVLDQARSDPLLQNVDKSLYLPVPHNVTADNLIERIIGAVDLPRDRVQLIFCGAILKGKALIPEEAFELNRKVPQDEDIFKPRVLLYLVPMATGESVVDCDDVVMEDEMTPIEDEVVNMVEKNNISKEKSETMRKHFNEELSYHQKQANIKAFDLYRDLEKIECAEHSADLASLGYADEGAFSCLNPEILTSCQAFYIPYKARVRILALAHTARTKIVAANEAARAAGKAFADTMDPQFRPIASDAMLKGMFVRSDSKKNKTMKRPTSSRTVFLVNSSIEPRKHPDALQKFIDQLRWDCAVDEYEINVNIRPKLKYFCCDAHARAVLQNRETYLDHRRVGHQAEIDRLLYVARMTARGNELVGYEGSMSRSALHMAALAFLRNREHRIDGTGYNPVFSPDGRVDINEEIQWRIDQSMVHFSLGPKSRMLVNQRMSRSSSSVLSVPLVVVSVEGVTKAECICDSPESDENNGVDVSLSALSLLPPLPVPEYDCCVFARLMVCFASDLDRAQMT